MRDFNDGLQINPCGRSTEQSRGDLDLARLMGAVARELLGEPNAALSTKAEWRYGERGSLVVDLVKGTFYDFETETGGGVLDLIARETGITERSDQFKWLRDAGIIDDDRPKANGKSGTARTASKIVAEYDYVDESGAFLFQVVRFDPKDFRQRTKDAKGNWTWSVKGARQVPYRLPELIETLANERLIFIVEGEKDVENLAKLGVPATCNAGGCGKWKAEYNAFFDKADVCIIADNDPRAKSSKTGKPLFHPDGRPKLPGQDHARDVAQHLFENSYRIRILDLKTIWPESPEKGDISDWIAKAGGTAEKLYEIIDQLKEWSPDEDEPEVALPYIRVSLDPLPRREWTVPERILAQTVCLLTGEGAVGKSLLLLQLAAAHVLGRDWIGTQPEPGPALIMACEDDEAEICRRLEAIAAHYRVTRTDLEKNGLHVMSFAGKDALLGTVDRTGAIKETLLFQQIRRDALRLRPKLVGIDTVADVFGGDEINRRQTRQFMTMQRGLAMETGGAVVLLAHPSIAGLKSDTGMSGSTAWHNSARSRMYFKTADDTDDAELRILEVKKNNYGPISESLRLRWRNGVYLPEPRTGSLEKMAAERKVDDLFQSLLQRFDRQGRNVTDKTGTSYAPAAFAAEPEAIEAKVSKKQLAEAMSRLFKAAKIRVVEDGPPSRRRSKIAEPEAT